MPRNNLPSVTSSDVPRDLRAWIDRVGESLSKLSEVATVSELAKAGVITVGPGGDVTGPGGGGGGDDGDVIIPVLTPPAPEGFQVTGGYEYIIVEWDAPEYYGHSYTVVFRSTTPDFPTEQTPVTVYGNVYSDYVGNANVVYDEEGNVTGYETFYYWIAFVNINEVQGPEVGPESAQTAINVDEVLTALAGKLTSTAFVNDLSTFLDNAPDNYVVKLGASGVAAGFGLANTGSDTDPEFDFAILADNFFITPPIKFNQGARPTSGVIRGDVWRLPPGVNTNNTPYAKYYIATVDNPTVIGQWKEINPAPFIVRTTDTTITNADGEQTFVPAGVYITDAYIQDGTIARAKIGTAAIDNAKIANAAISAAKVAYLDARNIVTGTLKSPNFTNEAGKAGFLLTMTESGTVFIPTLDTNGDFQFNADGTIVGTYDDSYNQEDVTFILRGANDTFPALQLVDGVTTINALNIRKQLKSVSWDTNTETFGFNIDIDAGTVQFRDGTGANVFEIVDGNSKGLVKMTAAAIRDTLKSYLYGNNASGSGRPGFYLNTGLAYNGGTSNPQFYIRGKNGRVLLAVDGDSETLAEEIKNSNITRALVAGALNQNPLFTDINYSDPNALRPRNYFVASTTRADTLSYLDTNYNIAKFVKGYYLDPINLNSDYHKDIELCTSAIRVDPSVKRYKITVKWKLATENSTQRTQYSDYVSAYQAQGLADYNNRSTSVTVQGGLSFRCAGLTGVMPTGKTALTQYNSSPDSEVYDVGNSNNTAQCYVLSDTNLAVTTNPDIVVPWPDGDQFAYARVLREDILNDDNPDNIVRYPARYYWYNNRVVRNRDTWFTTELVVEPKDAFGNRFDWMSFNAFMSTALPDLAVLHIDQVVIEPYELVGDKIVDNNGDPLGIFAWVQDKITQNNIETYFQSLAVTEAVIGNAQVNTLKIGENAVTVPLGASNENLSTSIAISGTETSAGSSWSKVCDTSPLSWADDNVAPEAITVVGFMNYSAATSGSDYETVRLNLFIREGSAFPSSWTYFPSSPNSTANLSGATMLQSCGVSKKRNHSGTLTVNYTLDVSALGLKKNTNYYFALAAQTNAGSRRMFANGMSVVASKR